MKKKKARKIARKYFLWWVHALGLDYGRVSILYVDQIEDTLEDGTILINPNLTGRCHTDWRYQETTIYISLDAIKRMDKGEIEKVVVHELMHVFLNEMREEGIDHEERVATNLQKAFVWVRSLAENKKGV